MDRDPSQPLKPQLTTAEAKERLRTAAQNVTLRALIGRRTWPVLAAVAASGYVAARLRLPTLLGSLLIQRSVPILLSALLGGGRHRSDSSSRSSESSDDSSLKPK